MYRAQRYASQNTTAQSLAISCSNKLGRSAPQHHLCCITGYDYVRSHDNRALTAAPTPIVVSCHVPPILHAGPIPFITQHGSNVVMKRLKSTPTAWNRGQSMLLPRLALGWSRFRKSFSAVSQELQRDGKLGSSQVGVLDGRAQALVVSDVRVSRPCPVRPVPWLARPRADLGDLRKSHRRAASRRSDPNALRQREPRSEERPPVPARLSEGSTPHGSPARSSARRSLSPGARRSGRDWRRRIQGPAWRGPAGAFCSRPLTIGAGRPGDSKKAQSAK